VSDALAAADAVVAPTRAVLADLERWYGFVGGRVIPNGRSARWVVTVAKEQFVLGSGRLWDEAKNVAALDAAARLLDRPVVLAGERTAPSGAPSRPAGAAQRLGAVPFDQLAVLLGRAAVFAHPARYEPFGLGPLEAGLSGCALVLGDIPSLREVWGGAATYVDPDDEEQLAAVLADLLADPLRTSRWGAEARRRAVGYRLDAMADAYLAAYTDLLADRVGIR
jgi:glycosyltransferase involved in cell wall biosynthesis